MAKALVMDLHAMGRLKDFFPVKVSDKSEQMNGM